MTFCFAEAINAKGAYVKVIISSDKITLSPIESKEQSFELPSYIEIMLCLCERMLIWNFNAEEVEREYLANANVN